GAIYNQGTLNLTASTITSNTANYAGGLYNESTATLTSNIVALNSAASGNDLMGDGVWGNPYTGGYNLIGDADYSAGLFEATNQWGTSGAPLDPMLGPLQDNGGPTFTRALLPGSPAIDQGNSPGVLTDGRGRLRPYDNLLIANSGDGSDIGAFEEILGPSAAKVSVSGRIVTSGVGESIGISNAVIVITDSQGNNLISRSNAFGYFTQSDVSTGTGVITITHKHYQFDPHLLAGLADDVNGLLIVPTN
ncbi:MAG: choice-of-anchor Q domain-containing protein, partial [Acidobacteriota bacterium]